MALRDARHLALVKPRQDFRWDSCVWWLWRGRDRLDLTLAAGSSRRVR